jgi:preprotein translocase subunit SecY
MLRAFADAFRIPELRQKFLLTLLLLTVYRLGAAIPTPGVDVERLTQNINSSGAGGALGLLGLVSGGNLSQFSIFALGVLPYITASIVMQILTTALPQLEAMQKEGPEGQKRINQYTRVAAIALGAVQALFFASLLLSQSAKVGWGANIPMFYFVVVLTQCAGIAATMWLGERITEYGIGNGISLIIFAGIVSRFPIEFQQTIALLNTGQVDLLRILAFFAMIIAVVAAIVMIQQGERRIPVQYARKVATTRSPMGQSSAGQASYIPLKINTAGVIPIIFASAILQLAQLVPQIPQLRGSDFAVQFSSFLSTRSFSGAIVEIILIVAFTYFYTTISFDPKRVAENLREYGGFIPGVRPGDATKEHLERISTRITLFGALFLAALAVIPNIVSNLTGITTFPLAGTTLLIVAGVALDTLKQIESQLAVRNYGGFLQKGRLRGRGGFQQ